MSLRLLLRPSSVSKPTPIHASQARSRSRLLFASLGTSALLVGGSLLASANQASVDLNLKPSPKPFSESLRAYVVYAMCSLPLLVDWSPTLLSVSSSIPGVKQITDAFVRVTFFNQFVGGDTAQSCLPLLSRLRSENKAALLVYSVEVDSSPSSASVDKIINEMIHAVDVAADFDDARGGNSKDGLGRKTWVAVKLTALLPSPSTLHRFSQHLLSARPPSSIPFPGAPHPADLDVLHAKELPEGCALTDRDIGDLRRLREGLVRICERAKKRGVRVVVDAEHSWYQPAIDAYVLSLTRQFNKLSNSNDGPKVQPLIYQTYQCYLRRTPAYLAQSIREAKAGGYALGVKLVRGAYHGLETVSHPSSSPSPSPSISPDPDPPVWGTKPETDKCYDDAARATIKQIQSDVHRPRKSSWWGGKKDKEEKEVPGIGVFFGTHNWGSCEVVLGELVNAGLAEREGGEGGGIRVGREVCERVVLGQLYGMQDELTDWIVGRVSSSEPIVLKYLPYGALSEVMPYLSRRAIENRSVLGTGAAAEERRRAWGEMRKRAWAWVVGERRE